MALRISRTIVCGATTLCLAMATLDPAMAQTIPNSADVGRIKPEEKFPARDHLLDKKISIPTQQNVVTVPEAAKSITLVLRHVTIHGSKVFSPEELEDTYAEYIGQHITLDKVYQIAGAITDRYREAGYFLSRAYIPAQEIDSGSVTINVVEGYVGAVDGANELSDSDMVQDAIHDLLKQKPLTSDAIERFLLLLNDLPGYSFGGTLSPLEGKEDGAVRLTLSVSKAKDIASLSYDNYSSRYLGPNELTASYSTSLLPFQQTSVSALTDTARTKLRYGTIEHSISLRPDMKLQLAAGITQALPGYTLESSEIESLSKFAGISFEYQAIRQRRHNLSLKVGFDGRNVTSDILGSPLTRDYIRAFRATADYDITDDFNGYNTLNFTLSKGVNWFSASSPRDSNLSRTGALPDFTKAELSISRLQSIADDWSAFIAGSGQWASGVLYSSEQFGYGGQAFGRAYDASDFTGDRGIKGAFEVRYNGFAHEKMVNIQPYGFYDVGKVWNDAIGQPPMQTASSAGAGLRFNTVWKQSGNIGFAWPIDRNLTTPIYGNGWVHGPRIILQITQVF